VHDEKGGWISRRRVRKSKMVEEERGKDAGNGSDGRDEDAGGTRRRSRKSKSMK